MDTGEIVNPSRECVVSPQLHRIYELADFNSSSQRTLTQERENLECQIRTYKGNDPLEPYYNYAMWLEEKSADYITVYEDILIKFKDIASYKQDPRLIYILVKYISTQSNPRELYQMVHDQSLGIKCSILYKYWASEFDKVNDFKEADRIFQLGMRWRAQPKKDLADAYIQFQLGIARRVLQGTITVLKQSTNSKTHSDTSKPRFSQVHPSRCDTQTDYAYRENEKENQNVYKRPSDTHKEFRKVERLSTKNEFKCPVAIFECYDPKRKPMYPKDLVYGDGGDIQLEEIRAVFYFSELREERRQEPVQELVEPINLTKSAVASMESVRSLQVTHSTLKRTYSDSNLPQDQSLCLKTDFIQPVEKPQRAEFPFTPLQKSSHILGSDTSIKDQSWYLRTDFIEPVKTGQLSKKQMFPAELIAFKNGSENFGSKENVATGGMDGDNMQKPFEDGIFNMSNQCASVSHHSPTASFTVNTKAAIDVIQKMWESPLAPRNPKVSNLSEKPTFFKMPTTRKSECFEVAEDYSTVDSNMRNETPVFPVPKPTNELAFPIYCEDDGMKQQTNVFYSRLSNRRSSRKVISNEDRLFTTINSLEICDDKKIQSNAVDPAASIVPVKLQDLPQQFENKENAPPGNEVVVNDYKMQEMQTDDENNENKNELFDETCSTKAFAMLLPSSTPFSRPDRSRVSRKSSIFNGSYVEENENFGAANQIKSSGVYVSNNVSTMNVTKNPTNLSLILENSKEQGYSSSGGNAPKSIS